jgi:hypothetical protein
MVPDDSRQTGIPVPSSVRRRRRWRVPLWLRLAVAALLAAAVALAASYALRKMNF